MSITLDKLSTAKQDLLKRMLEEEMDDSNKIVNLEPWEEKPLSFSQQRLWFLDKYLDNKAIYNVPFYMKMKGTVDKEALRFAFNEIIHRHQVLKSFIVDGEKATVGILENFEFQLEVISAKEKPIEEKAGFIHQYIEENTNFQFDLNTGPLFTVKLLECSDSESILLVNMHHIIFDGWSQQLFIKEFSHYYNDCLEKNPTHLLDPISQYWDYSNWQQSWFDDGNVGDQIHYWSTKLGGKLPILELPTDYPRPSKQTFNGSNIAFELPKEVSSQLKKICKEEGVTPNMALLAVYKILLYRYTGNDDILVGTPIAGRNHEEVEELIGFFINTLVIRTNLSEKPSFRDYLKQVKNVCLEAYSNQDVPFEKLVEKLSPERSTSVSPIFQVLFSLQNTIPADIHLKDLEIEMLEIENKTAKFDLALFMQEDHDRFLGEFQYNTDLFNRSTIERMCKHFVRLVSEVVNDLSQQITAISILTKDETKLFHQINSKEPNCLEGAVHQHFEQQVEKTPYAIAIEYQGCKMTYQELNIQANQLAYELIRKGVSQDKPVAVCLERTPDLLVAFLAILKAGSFYLPFDAGLPQRRIKAILEDGEPTAIITNSQYMERMKEYENRLVFLNDHMATDDESDQNNPNLESHPDHLAYMIYTSGSTGKPKGVAIQNKSVIRLVKNPNYIQIMPNDHIAQISNAAFDAITFEAWGALLNGAKLIIAEKESILSSQKFSKWLKENNICSMFITVALFNKVAQEEPTAFSNMKYLLVGGDACSPKMINRVLAHGPPEKILNAYGPTESTTFALTYGIDSNNSPNIEIVPIGKPISNTQVHVLDSNMNPVPIGVPGELFIGGDGLAVGYWNQRSLTEEKFVKNPFSTDPKSKIYKTGDIVRYLPDGNIDYIGRVDHQIKLRGYRIELGEIEESLRQTGLVKEGVVLLKKAEQEEPKIVSYYTSLGNVSKKEIRDALSKVLPDYMIPSIFIQMEKLPFTPNGKVDRRQLPEPTSLDMELREYVAPQSMMEEILVEIWCEVLGNNRIGIHDNFFEIGGHSLLATKVISRIRSVLEQSVSIRMIFEYPTIYQLSPILENLIFENDTEMV
ncbi:amino acid adenylation domain-containing protein [Bacillus pakistanensis]|uniref:Amino acid adenylation domain-containing protein n=1 Tax=Rossellomorea pakistanensis TaxID=992288 RepID=A0ABS2NE79_9BACI|nr:non-ribosomal peptide synthetase [Bacillus pakistanensis]MBM7586118.1 amino acid adenylation domain-containing protein [Bacillus pakistanensis]